MGPDVEAGVEAFPAELYLAIGPERVDQLRVAVPRGRRRSLHDAVRLVTAKPLIIDESEEHGLGVHEATRSVEVLLHPG